MKWKVEERSGISGDSGFLKKLMIRLANQSLPLVCHKLIATGTRVLSLHKGAKLWCKGTLV